MHLGQLRRRLRPRQLETLPLNVRVFNFCSVRKDQICITNDYWLGWFDGGDTSFVPRSIPGKAERPPQIGVVCRGFDYGKLPLAQLRQRGQIDLQPLLTFYAQAPDQARFFLPFFDKLAGSSTLRTQITAGWSEAQIRKSWEEGLQQFAAM